MLEGEGAPGDCATTAGAQGKAGGGSIGHVGYVMGGGGAYRGSSLSPLLLHSFWGPSESASSRALAVAACQAQRGLRLAIPSQGGTFEVVFCWGSLGLGLGKVGPRGVTGCG